ncbi:hypothetical protein [Aquibacillus rhizosphaerae]|uniref:Uncharacterized protein n=1 Tax=Aquibacillus rhizosphaerae TaxID=3051431 RepID=A0ABT7LAK9_9BACI|nr:hypothetical protein [Aquibacillus sp. LR5S19]MDL4842240.1 hypothetical protein [Aquibacillus sp. LR5S19]
MLGEQIAVKLELVARRALNIKQKDGMAGVISTDYILNKNGAFTVICAALAPYYLNATNEERVPLDALINRYKSLEDCNSETYFKTMDRATEDLRSLLHMLGVQDAE